jgi:hypothetical protein
MVMLDIPTTRFAAATLLNKRFEPIASTKKLRIVSKITRKMLTIPIEA